MKWKYYRDRDGEIWRWNKDNTLSNVCEHGEWAGWDTEHDNGDEEFEEFNDYWDLKPISTEEMFLEMI
jgi:hypothetical protein